MNAYHYILALGLIVCLYLAGVAISAIIESRHTVKKSDVPPQPINLEDPDE